jgi:hypothetical protein
MDLAVEKTGEVAVVEIPVREAQPGAKETQWI